MLSLLSWLSTLPILVVGAVVFIAMSLAAAAGFATRARQDLAEAPGNRSEGSEGYLVSAVLGLLALLMGFTFSLAVDRFETRRMLVLEESNAIGTAYLRAQLLDPPHRQRVSDILVAYTGNRLALAKATPEQAGVLRQRNDAMLTDLWAATSAAFVTIRGIDFSSSFLDSINSVIDLDAARKVAREARVPAEVFAILVVYLVVTSGVIGYVLTGRRGRVAAGFTLALLMASFLLILDIDRPGLGGVRESQRPMELLKASLTDQPPEVFDRYRAPTAALPDSDGGR